MSIVLKLKGLNSYNLLMTIDRGTWNEVRLVGRMLYSLVGIVVRQKLTQLKDAGF